jgi:hypothetical protein
MNATRQALAAWAGMIGSAIFVAVFVLEDFLRPDFNWLRTPVSEHALATPVSRSCFSRLRNWDSQAASSFGWSFAFATALRSRAGDKI